MKSIVIFPCLILVVCSVAFARIGGGEITFQFMGKTHAAFSHEAHVSEIGINCISCHPSPYITREKDKRATMGDMEKGRSCGICRNGKDKGKLHQVLPEIEEANSNVSGKR